MNKELMFSSKDQAWETPWRFFRKIDDEFGFDLDVCATSETAKCDNYFDKEVDGLKQDWEGVCWMNPPYGRELRKWIEKAYKESLKGTTVVCLIPSRTDTTYWHDFIFPYASEIRFIKGRLKFGNSKNSAPFPSALIVFNNNSKQKITTINL